jgi:DNA-directed RNA polymerase specialized sigma24 family protein
MNEYDDLLRRCADDDVEATQRLDALVAAFAAPYINRLRHEEFPESDREDALREIWRKAYAAIRIGKGPAGFALESWVKKIAIRERSNCVRRRIRDRKYFCRLDSMPDSAEPAILDADQRKKLAKIAVIRAVLESFHGQERQILEGIIRGLADKQLSADIGLSFGTYRRRKGEVLAEAKRRGLELWERGTNEPDE